MLSKSSDSTSSVSRERFASLWDRCRTSDSNACAEPVWEMLIERYGESQRHYHDTVHLQHCLRQFDLASHEMENPDAVEMALWFHDIVYSPDTEFNELKSAELFERVAAGNFAPGFVAAVRKLILATEHRQAPDCSNEPYVVDIDLSGFGLSWEEYMRDNRALRAEVKHMPDAQYYAGKLKFLQSLLGRQRIYSTDFFFKLYEARARKNIQRFIRRLEKEEIL